MPQKSYLSGLAADPAPAASEPAAAAAASNPAAPPPGQPLVSQVTGRPLLRSVHDLQHLPAPHKEAHSAVASDPIVKAILGADVPGLLANAEEMKHPEVQTLVANPKALIDHGLALYGALDGSTALFNPKIIRQGEVRQADQQGVLAKMFPHVTEYLGGDKSIPAGAVPTDPNAGPPPVPPGGAPAAAAPPADVTQPPAGGPAPPAGISAPPASSGSVVPVGQARATAIQAPAKPPTSQHIPGAGFLNDLARPVV